VFLLDSKHVLPLWKVEVVRLVNKYPGGGSSMTEPLNRISRNECAVRLVTAEDVVQSCIYLVNAKAMNSYSESM
jgi:hypothetical protein